MNNCVHFSDFVMSIQHLDFLVFRNAYCFAPVVELDE